MHYILFNNIFGNIKKMSKIECKFVKTIIPGTLSLYFFSTVIRELTQKCVKIIAFREFDRSLKFKEQFMIIEKSITMNFGILLV